jgi:hypothetical protein
MKTFVKHVLLFICFAIGAAFAIGTIHTFAHPGYFDSALDVPFLGMFAAIFLLAAFLLFRWKTNVIDGNDPIGLAPTNNAETDRLRRSMNEFIKIICEDNDPSEVQSSAYALASAAGFLVGFASAKVGSQFEQFHGWCREGFEKSAQNSYQAHSR